MYGLLSIHVWVIDQEEVHKHAKKKKERGQYPAILTKLASVVICLTKLSLLSLR